MTSIEARRRRVSDECLSDLQIDTLLAGEIAGSLEQNEAKAITAHLVTCAACEGRVVAYRASYRAFAQATSLPILSATTLQAVEARAQRPFWLTRLAPVLAAGAAFALAGVFLLPKGTTPLERSKGAPSFSVFVKRGERVFPGESGGEYHAGDRLRFSYSSERPVFFALFSLEASGRVSRFVPAEGSAPLALPAGAKVELEGSTELDDALGTERLIGVFCDTGFDLAAAFAALSPEDPERAIRSRLDGACVVSSFLLEKR